ncbi:ATP-binding protein [Micromonospora endophytica]|uniref:XRE family transcriptional regulator n=1 Tax=Micromonospora endophytica TaxID=515350 RepID=A0A2W2CKD3_9ACTN|nr:helix-turn-helix domain-containing protein [Micromonospora endophytica]PZF98400.1 XRE family transcriptional regulator [Micromonospora endophytica]RIW47762.1 XRE family transcriptional regulator [Micromonospora endophytica]
MTSRHDRPSGSGSPSTLPELLRRHRLAAGLTQAELATHAGIGVRTVRDLERGRSSRPQRTTVELLADALGLTGADRAAFLAAARPAAPGAVADGKAGAPAAAPVSGTPARLPPPPELVGREQDLIELVTTLREPHGPRVVTLVGLAGAGKTALALAVVHAVLAADPGGLTGVLAGAGANAGAVLAAAIKALGATRMTELIADLGDRRAVLLVDAAEQAPGPVAGALRQLVDEVPSLRMLVTSRHPVGLPDERVRPVSPLDVPPPGDIDPAALAGYPAVALFTARLAQLRPDPPAAAELPALAALVRRSGGLPLAIELMAARGRLLDLNELLNRYGDRVLDLDTSGGARTGWEAGGTSGVVRKTLRDAMATSYRLLTTEERLALRRLAMFRGRWSVELAEEMLVAPGLAVDPVSLLNRFLDLGLLSVRGGGPFRFRLVDMVRDYAVEQAIEAGESSELHRRHAEVITRLVERTASGPAGAGATTTAAHRLDEVSADISAALTYATADDPLTALRLATNLPWWWRVRGRDVPGRQWLLRLLADPRTDGADPALRAWASLGVALLAGEHGAAGEEIRTARVALDAFRRLGDVSGELEARTVLAVLLAATGRPEQAREQAEVVLALATEGGLVRQMAVAQHHLAWHEIRIGDLTAARRRLAVVDRLGGQCGERCLRVLARSTVAEVFRLEGRYADAADEARKVLADLTDLGVPRQRRRALGTLGLALAQGGRPAEAAEVLAELRPLGATGALVEGHLALSRGDREGAAEWYAAAVEAVGANWTRRTVVEALVGLAVSTSEPIVLDRLDRVCRDSGIRLLRHEAEQLRPLHPTRGDTPR